MASEDKTYCGRGERDQSENLTNEDIAELANRLGISQEDVMDVISQVGYNRLKIEAYFHDKENSY